jgi:hypothetical protein
MAAIFISYRRDDTISATGRLADALASRFGSEEIFRDVQAIEAGADFRAALRDALRSAQVVLVVIGRFWNPSEYVRMEIEEAIAQDIPLLPVLVEGARMPAAGDLPEPIRALAYRQAHEISETRWSYDTDRLVDLIARQTGASPQQSRRSSAAADHGGHHWTAAFMQLPNDLLRLVYDPQRFLTARAIDTHGAVLRVGIFLVVSQLLAAILILQEWPSRSPVNFVTSAPLLLSLVAFVLSLPMYVAWRLAGAPREYQRVLVIFAYQCSFVGLCSSLVAVVMLTGMEMTIPGRLDALAASPTIQEASVFLRNLETAPENRPWIIAALITVLIGVGVVLWCARSWGAYRLALGRSRLHSVAALLLFLTFVAGPIGFLVWVGLLLSPQN